MPEVTAFFQFPGDKSGLVHHPRLGLAQGNLRIQESLREQVKAAKRLPHFELRALWGPSPAAHGSPYDSNLRNDFGDLNVFTQTEVAAIQPLYTFGQLEGKADAAQHAVEAARLDADRSANEIRRETQRLY